MNGEEPSLPAAESRRELPAAESGVADRRRSHVDAAARAAEIHRDADDVDGLHDAVALSARSGRPEGEAVGTD